MSLLQRRLLAAALAAVFAPLTASARSDAAARMWNVPAVIGHAKNMIENKWRTAISISRDRKIVVGKSDLVLAVENGTAIAGRAHDWIELERFQFANPEINNALVAHMHGKKQEEVIASFDISNTEGLSRDLLRTKLAAIEHKRGLPIMVLEALRASNEFDSDDLKSFEGIYEKGAVYPASPETYPDPELLEVERLTYKNGYLRLGERFHTDARDYENKWVSSAVIVSSQNLPDFHLFPSDMYALETARALATKSRKTLSALEGHAEQLLYARLIDFPDDFPHKVGVGTLHRSFFKRTDDPADIQMAIEKAFHRLADFFMEAKASTLRSTE